MVKNLEEEKSYLFYLILLLSFTLLLIIFLFYKEKKKPPEILLTDAYLFAKEGDYLVQGPIFLEDNFNLKLEAVLKGKKNGKEVYFSKTKKIILNGKLIEENLIKNFEEIPYILKFLWFTFEPEKIYYYITNNSLEDFKWKTFFLKDTNYPEFSPPLEAQNTSFLSRAPFGEFLGKYYGTMRYSLRVEIYDKKAPRIPILVLHTSQIEKPETSLMVVLGKGEKGKPLYYFTSYGNLPYFSIPPGNLQLFKDTILKLISNRWAFGSLFFCYPENYNFKVLSVYWDGNNIQDLTGKFLFWGKDLEEGDLIFSQNQIVIFYEKGKGKVDKNAKILSHTKSPLLISKLSDIPPGNFTLLHFFKK